MGSGGYKTYPKFCLFIFRHANIAYRLVSPSVLPCNGSGVGTAADDTQAAEANADSIALGVVGRILAQERVCGDDASDVTEADLPGRANCASVVTTKVHVEPANHNGHGRVGPHAGQEEGGVHGVQIRVYVQEDGVTDDRNKDRSNSEQEPVLEVVGHEGDSHPEAEGSSPGRNRSKLRLDRAVVIALDNCRSKVSESVRALKIELEPINRHDTRCLLTHDQAKVHKAAQPDLVIFHDGEDIPKR